MMDSCAACGFFGLPPGEAVRCPSCGELTRLALPPLDRKIGRNEPCPCGSGSKFKRCHGDGRS